MERWGKAWKDIFFSHNKRISRPVDIVFTVYLGTKLLLNMMEAEGLAKFNIDVFVTILGVIGIIISYFIIFKKY